MTDVSNSEFLRTVLGELPLGQHGWVCSWVGNPNDAPPGVWGGRPYKGKPAEAGVLDKASNCNNYFAVSVLNGARGKDAFVRLRVLVADDVVLDDIAQMSYAIESREGNFQVGIVLDPEDQDCADRELVDKLMTALADRGLVKLDKAGNNLVRYVRLPQGVNGKPDAKGWQVRLVKWNPDQVLSLADAAAVLGVDIDELKAPSKVPVERGRGEPHGARWDALTDRILKGEQLHDSLRDLAAGLVAGGLQGGAVVELLRVLMHKSEAPRDARWEGRFAEIPRLVNSAEDKFPPAAEAAPQITVNLRAPVKSLPMEHPQPQRLQWAQLPANPPEVPFVIPGWMPANVVTLLAAHGGTGKSFISLLIALSLATGRHPFTGEDIPPARVVVYSCEDGMPVMQLRLRRLMAMLQIDEAELQGQLDILDATEADNVLFVENGREGAKTTPRFDWLREHCQAFRAEVLIFDNASDAYGADENNRALVRQFLSTLRRIAPTVLLLSHVDAASSMADPRDAKGYSGSTAWNNSARSRWFMAREKNDDILLRVPKVNYAPAGIEATLRWDDQHKVFAVAGVRHGQPKAKDCAPIILTLLREQLAAGAEVSPAINAANSVHNLLKHDPRYPSSVRPADVAAMARQWISTGQVALEEFPRRNRTLGQRLRIPGLHTVAHGLAA